MTAGLTLVGNGYRDNECGGCYAYVLLHAELNTARPGNLWNLFWAIIRAICADQNNCQIADNIVKRFIPPWIEVHLIKPPAHVSYMAPEYVLSPSRRKFASLCSAVALACWLPMLNQVECGRAFRSSRVSTSAGLISGPGFQ